MTHLSHCVVATDDNPLYAPFLPLVYKAWTEIVGVQVSIIFVGKDIPEEWPQCVKDAVTVFEPIPNIPTGFQAQVIRLFAPSWIETNDLVIISDADIVPLKKDYFQCKDLQCASGAVVNYRYGNIEDKCKQISMCYVAAQPTIWRRLFPYHGMESVRNCITSWWGNDLCTMYYAKHPKWCTDQRELYKAVQKFSGSVICLTDAKTKFNRLCRSKFLLDTVDFDNWCDFHMFRPHTGQNKQKNEDVVRRAL